MTATSDTAKLVIAVVHDRDKGKVSRALVTAGHSFTVMASTGGFLREGNVTYLIGTSEAAIPDIMALIEENSKTREQFVNAVPPDAGNLGAFVDAPVRVSVGGAIAFVVNVEQFFKF